MTFTNPALTGAIDVTVTGADVTPVSWLGINAVNLTIPVNVGDDVAQGAEQVDVTIPNLDDVTVSGDGNYLLVIANDSSLRDLGAPENAVGTTGACSTHPLAALGGSDCAGGFTMDARAGTIAVIATILEVDDNGSLDPANDTIVGVRTYAIARNVVVTPGDVDQVTLTVLADDQLVDATIELPGVVPASLSDFGALLAIDLGAEGLITVDSVFNAANETQPVPSLAALASAGEALSYEIVGIADDRSATPTPAESVSFIYGVTSLASAIALPDWLTPPEDITVSADGLTITHESPGAPLHLVEIATQLDGRVWTVLVFDGRATIVLPALALLADGNTRYAVRAVALPGFVANDFVIPEELEDVAQVSSNAVVVTVAN